MSSNEVQNFFFFLIFCSCRICTLLLHHPTERLFCFLGHIEPFFIKYTNLQVEKRTDGDLNCSNCEMILITLINRFELSLRYFATFPLSSAFFPFDSFVWTCNPSENVSIIFVPGAIYSVSTDIKRSTTAIMYAPSWKLSVAVSFR